jgi:hypothetical protein
MELTSYDFLLKVGDAVVGGAERRSFFLAAD